MSPTIKYTALPALQTNYIWIVSDERNAVAIDPGDAAPVKALLTESGLQLSAILLTHHHHDHVGGVANLLGEYDVPVYGPAYELIEWITHPVREGDIVCPNKLPIQFTVLDIPGHTRGHIAFFQDEKREAKGDKQRREPPPPHLFCGDTLFASGCGRLFEGTPQQMLASLDKLAALPDTTYVHCAHEYTLANLRFALMCEPNNAELYAWQHKAQALRDYNQPTVPTTIGYEKQVNPFLRVDNLALQQRLAHLLSVPVNDRLTAFTVMRKWKDQC